jgi:hypothetical protein
MFHTHLVWHALALLPPLCPIAKGKCYMFVFVLQVLGRDGPGPFRSGSSLLRRRVIGLADYNTSLAPLAPPPPLNLPFYPLIQRSGNMLRLMKEIMLLSSHWLQPPPFLPYCLF